MMEVVKCQATNKEIWETGKRAREQAKAYRRHHGQKMSAYPCDFCDGWHIGHKLYHKYKQKIYKDVGLNPA